MRNALLITEMRQDPKTEQWNATTEELVLGPINLPMDDARCVVEEVQFAGSMQ
jgi:hypothetical protein